MTKSDTKEETVKPVTCNDCKFWWPNLCIAINEYTKVSLRACSLDGTNKKYFDTCDQWKDKGYRL
jgi:hypothetical protein